MERQKWGGQVELTGTAVYDVMVLLLKKTEPGFFQQATQI